MQVTKISSNYNQQGKKANSRNNNPTFGIDLRLQGPLGIAMKEDMLNSGYAYDAILNWKLKAADILPKNTKAFLGFDLKTKKFFVTSESQVGSVPETKVQETANHINNLNEEERAKIENELRLLIMKHSLSSGI